jgi:hypothetical protein
MNEELIKYVMERANKCYSDDFPIYNIEIWIREFFDQYKKTQDELIESSKERKWRYECYICGARSEGQGELIKSCNCKHGPPIKLYHPI